MNPPPFPAGFRWGAATSAYQIEGGHDAGGRGPSIWDTFAREPGRVKNGDTGDTACDSYRRWAEDVALLKQLGAGVYRFSISWPRLFPRGRGPINEAGLAYYRTLIDALLAAGIEPFVTLYHWDLPQALQDEGGWENRATADAFCDYAEAVFRAFHGKVKHWVTFNEPFCSSFVGNWYGAHAPGKSDMNAALACAHHTLLAHGRTVRRFRSLVAQGLASGGIGLAPNITWAEPWTESAEDRAACLRPVQWSWDWFLDPVLFGRYPRELAEWFERKGFSVPVQPGDFDEIRGELDFVGGNYYCSSVNRHSLSAEGGVLESAAIDMGYEKSALGWPLTPDGFCRALARIQNKYGDLPVWITENGIALHEHDDPRRIVYLRQHLASLRRALALGVPVVGYLAWSLLDNFEWAEGYTQRFGLVGVDFATGERTPKPSFAWYRDFIHTAAREGL